jgi:sugar-specific transcriptional regulator TrmB/predicted transcriptional regulator
LSEDEIFNVLRDLGLSRREAEIYMFLSHNGMQQAAFVSTRLKIERVQTYRALKSLQDKGMVEATLEAPVRFSSVPFETLLESLIKTKKADIVKLETKKDDLVTYWQSISAKVSDLPVAKFRVVVEQKRIYQQVGKMINRAKKEILQLTTGLGVIQEDTAGILDAIMALSRKKPVIQAKILSNVSKDNMELMKRMLRSSVNHPNIQWRHVDLSSRILPQFSVMDDQETILYVTRGDISSHVGQADTGLWIRSEMFASALKESFLEIWNNAATLENRIKELETGKPVEETLIIRDPGEAEEKLMKTIGKAKKDIVMIASSDTLGKLSGTDLFPKTQGKTVNYRIMTPIDLDNLDAARNLSNLFNVRSVPITYMSMLAVDNEHLFMFKTISNGRTATKTPFNMENVFYTNDARYVERAMGILDELWKRGIDVKEMISGGAVEAPMVEVASSDNVTIVVNRMIKENVSSVIVAESSKPIGIVSEKDILKKIVRMKKDPDKITVKDIMSMPIMSVEASNAAGLAEALRKMRKSGVSKLAVFRNGKLSGMLAVK